MNTAPITDSLLTDPQVAAKINQDFIYMKFQTVGAAASNVVDLGGVITAQTISDSDNADWTDRPGAFFPDSTVTKRYMHIGTDDADWPAVRSVLRFDTGAYLLMLTTIDISTVTGAAEDVSEYFFTIGEISGGSPANGFALRQFTSGTGSLGIIGRDKGGNSTGEISTNVESVLGGAGVYSVGILFDIAANTVEFIVNNEHSQSGNIANSVAELNDFNFDAETAANSYGVAWFESCPNDNRSSAWTGTLNMNVNAQTFGMRDFGAFKFTTAPTAAQINAILNEHNENPGRLPRSLMGLT